MKHQDIIDDAIERTLVRDSKTLPPFPTTPNSALTTKLAISIASKGMLSTLGAKLALFGGLALIAGAALYYSTSNNAAPIVASTQRPPSPIKVIATDTTKRDSVRPAQVVASAKPKVSMNVRRVHYEPSQPKSLVTPSDSAPLKRVLNPNYGAPLK